MERNQFWIFLALIFAIGIGFESMKDSKPSKIKFAGLGRLQALLDEGRQVYTPSTNDDSSAGSSKAIAEKRRQAEPKLAGLSEAAPARAPAPATAPGATATPTPTPNATSAAEKAKKEKEEAEKKKKEEEKKKKKKKKKKVKGTGQEEEKKAEDEEEKKEEEEKDKAGASSDLPEAAPAAVVTFNPPTDGIPQSADEWKRLLLDGEPSYEKTSALVKYFQAGLVTEDVFYEVVEEMLDDKRDEMRLLGVMALGATPSVRSFALLTDVKREEAPGSKLRSHAETYMRYYTRLENLRHLASVLRMDGEPLANQQAIRMLAIATNTHLKNAKSDRPGELGGEGRVPATAGVVRYFNPFLALLQQVSQRSSDAKVREAAGQSLAELSGLLPKPATPSQDPRRQVRI